MTKLLDQAIAVLRDLPEPEQDEAAEALLSMVGTLNASRTLDAATRRAILEGLAQARRGEFASDADVEAVYRRHGA